MLSINKCLPRLAIKTETEREPEIETEPETDRDSLVVLFLCRTLTDTEWAEKESYLCQKQEANVTGLWSPIHTSVCGHGAQAKDEWERYLFQTCNSFHTCRDFPEQRSANLILFLHHTCLLGDILGLCSFLLGFPSSSSNKSKSCNSL